ncbi:MAG: DUF1080 domain-containing protein [Tannerella sp.]|jgi:hypothetical protein|nr:DUF1080 domain-containing protein [Tannerella sp.]
MKKAVLLTFVCLLICSITGVAQNNQLTEQEKKDGWVLLFDGKSMAGWRACNETAMPDNWVVENGIVRVITSAEKRAKLPPAKEGERQRIPAVDILYGAKKFKNFEFSIDWNVGKGGNSGVFYGVTEIPGRPIYTAGIEVQILDNIDAGDNKLYNHLAGSLYDMLPAVPQNAKPAGEWNTLVIKMQDGKVTHSQNGRVVCEYTVWTPEWYKMIAESKFRTFEHLQEPNPTREGYIGLQDHNDFGCSFRNIKIREL